MKLFKLPSIVVNARKISLMERLEERILFDGSLDSAQIAPQQEAVQSVELPQENESAQNGEQFESSSLKLGLIIVEEESLSGDAFIKSILDAHPESTFQVYILEQTHGSEDLAAMLNRLANERNDLSAGVWIHSENYLPSESIQRTVDNDELAISGIQNSNNSSFQLERSEQLIDSSGKSIEVRFYINSSPSDLKLDSTSTQEGASLARNESSDQSASPNAVLPQSADATTDQNYELVVIDKQLRNYQILVQTLERAESVKIVFIDGDVDGISHLSNLLADVHELNAIHILSHGTQGVFNLGSARLTAESMQLDYAPSLQQIGNALRHDGDILIYGCDFSSTADGNLAAILLSQLTGADVATSSDATGSSLFGGNWILENRVGSIETSSLNLTTWNSLMAPPVVIVPGDQEMIEDANLVFDAMKAITVASNETSELTVTLSVNDATLLLSTTMGLTFLEGSSNGQSIVKFRGHIDAISAALLNLELTPTLNFFGSIVLQTIADDGNSTTTRAIDINVVSQNDAPILTINPINSSANGAPYEGGTHIFTAADIHTLDPDNSDQQLVYILNTLPTSGVLRLNGNSVAIGTIFTQTQLINGQLSYVHDGSEIHTDSFNLSVNDGAGGHSGPATVVIQLTPINDPMSISASATVYEGGSTNAPAIGAGKPVPGFQLNISDTESDEKRIVIQSLPGGGTLYFNSVATTQTDIDNGFNFSAGDIGLLEYVHDGVDDLGTQPSDRKFLIEVYDQGGGSQTVERVQLEVLIDVIGVNDDLQLVQYDSTEHFIPDGESYTLSLSDMEVHDPDGPNGSITYTLENMPTHGILLINGNPAAKSATFTQAQLAAGLVTFIHNETTGGKEQLRFTVRDGSVSIATDELGALRESDQNSPIRVLTLNFDIEQPPSTGNFLLLEVVEGETITISDFVPGDQLTISSLPADGELLLNGIPILVNESFTVGLTDVIEYVHSGIHDGQDQFIITRNSELTFVDIRVFLANDAPIFNILQNLTTVYEGRSHVIDANWLQASDEENSNPSDLFYTIVGYPSNGQVFLDNQLLSNFSTFTYQDVIDGRVSYLHDGDEQFLDQLSLSLSDGSITVTKTLLIQAIPVNDTPQVHVSYLQMLEGQTRAFSNANLGVGDPDGINTDLAIAPDSPIEIRINSLPTHGQLRYDDPALGWIDVTIGFQFLRDNISRLSYTHNGSENFQDTFNFTVIDNHSRTTPFDAPGTINGAMQIEIVPVNDPPAVTTNIGLVQDSTSDRRVYEGGVKVITSEILFSTDPDSTDEQIQYLILEAPANGTLLRGGSAIGPGSSFTQVDLLNGVIRYRHNGSETLSDKFVFRVDDSASNVAPTTVSIGIIPINDAPAISAPSLTVVDNGNYHFTGGSTISVSDVDVASGNVRVQLTVNDSNGSLTVVAFGSTLVSGADTSITLIGSLADVNSTLSTLRYSTIDQNSEFALTVVANDLGNTGVDPSSVPPLEVPNLVNTGDATSEQATRIIRLLVSTVNDAPIVDTPSPQRILEDLPLIFNTANGNQITISDADHFGADMEVTLSSTEGRFSLSTLVGLSVISGSSTNSTSVVIRGSLDAINEALNGMTFLGNSNFNGMATLSVTANDLGNTGVGPSTNVSNTVSILIDPINDAPIVSTPTGIWVLDGVTLLPGITIQDIDYNDGGHPSSTTGEVDFFQVTIRLTDGAGTPLSSADHAYVTLASTNTSSGSTIDSNYNGIGSALVIRGTRAQVADYLAGLNLEIAGPLVNDDHIYRIQIIADDRLRDSNGELDISEHANGGPNISGTGEAVAVPATEIDPYAPLSGNLTANVHSNFINVISTTANEAPGFLNMPSSVTYTEGIESNNGTAVRIAFSGIVSDPELSALNNWDQTTISVARQGIANIEDLFSFASVGGVTTNATNIFVNGTSVGQYTITNGSLSIIFLGPAATTANVTSVLQSIQYQNSNNVPPASVTLQLTVNDRDTDPDREINPQGTGGELTGQALVTVNIVPVNDSPTLTGLTTAEYREDGPPVVLAPMADIFDHELNSQNGGVGNWSNATLILHRQDLANPTDQFFSSGQLSSLTQGTSLSYNGIHVGSVVANSGGRLEILFAEGTTTNQVRDVFRAISYSNTTQSLRSVDLNNIFLSWTVNDRDLDPDRPTNPQGTTGEKRIIVNQAIVLRGTNDPPAGADFERTINQNGSYTFSSSNFGFTDPVDQPDDTFINVLITTLPTQGTLTLNGVAVSAGQYISVTNINANRLVWTPPANQGGPNFSSFTFQVQDSGGTANGGSDLDATPNTVLFHVNRPPALVTTLPDRASLDSQVINIDLSTYFSDPEGHTFNYTSSSLPPGLSINATTGVISGTLGSSASQAGSYPVTITLQDQLGASQSFIFNWTVTNPLPLANNDSRTADENDSLSGNVITNDSDPDGDAIAVSEINGIAANLGIAVSGSNGGQFVVQSNGSYTFSQGTSFDNLPAGATRQTYVEYTLRDIDGGTARATLLVTVTGTNDAPTSSPIPNRTNLDGDIANYNISSHFSDVDADDTLVFTLATPLPPGLILHPTTGFISGTIDRSASVQIPNGEYIVTVVATDKLGASTSRSFMWTVSNPPPTANDDVNETIQNHAVSGEVIGNDSDPDLDPLFVSAVNGATANVGVAIAGSHGGQFTIQSDGSYTFDPGTSFDYLPLDATQETTVEYTVSDGQGGTAIATVTVTVTGLNDAPTSTVILDRSNLDYDPINWDLKNIFSDVDNGATLKFSYEGTLPPGLLLDPDTGIVTGRIASNASQFGPYSVKFIATDAHGASSEQSFVWTVTNPAPTAIDDDYSTDELTPVTGNVIINLTSDTDPDLDSLTVLSVNGLSTNVGQPIVGSEGGIFIVQTDGTVSFDPGTDFIYLGAGEQQSTSVLYTITDGEGGVSTATITVNVNGINSAPISTELPDLTNNDWDNVNISIASYFDDPDTSNALIFTAGTSLPPGLSIHPNTGVITGRINSDASVNGPYTVTITATDPLGLSTTQSFTWNVNNLPPIAEDDLHETFENTVLNSSVKGNDSDPDQDITFVVEVNGVSANLSTPIIGSHGGEFTVEADGSYRFDPLGDFNDLLLDETRETHITYRLSDGQGGFDVATLIVTVKGVNDAPISQSIPDQNNNDSDVVNLDLSSSFSDPDTNDTLRYSDNGTLPPGLSIDVDTGLVSGSIDSSASAGGPYLVTITVTDSEGESQSESFIWNIENPPPVANDDDYTVSGSDSSAIVGNAISNDSDPDNDVLVTVPQTNIAGSNGGIFYIASDGTISFDPNGEFNHVHVTDSIVTTIEYQLMDADGAMTTATISVTVLGINRSPVAVDDHYEMITNNLSGKAFDNDSDPDGHAITGEVTVPPQHGTLTWNPDGSFSYQPGRTFIGSDQFTYTIYDIYGESSTAVVYITRPFAWDSFRNESIPKSLLGTPTAYHVSEQLASYQLNLLASNPILAGYATPGTVLRGKIYDPSGSVIAEVTTKSNAAGNWVMNFYHPMQTSNPIVIIEHVASEEVILGNVHHFRLTDNTYRSLQLGVEQRNSQSIGSILADRPSLVLQRMHQQNLYPLALR